MTCCRPPNIQRKVGLKSSEFKLKLDSKDHISTLGLDSEELRSLFMNALEKASTGALQSVSSALQSVVETLPNNSELAFWMLRRDHHLGPAFITGKGVTIYFYNYGSESRSSSGNAITIVAPGIRDLPFHVDQPSSSEETLLSLWVQFVGTPPRETQPSVDENCMSQIENVMRICLDKVKSVLSSNKFGDLSQLTDRVAALLVDQNDDYSDIIDVYKIRIKSRIHVRDRGRFRQIASAHASFSKSALSGSNKSPDVTNDGQGQITDRIFIALGSNLGDRLRNIEEACRNMDDIPNTRILRTSALYETAPMYVEDQGSFLNGVCEVRFSSQVNKFSNENRSKPICPLSNSSTNCRQLNNAWEG